MKTEERLGRALGEVLREQRLKRDLSQEKLALEAGLDRTYISMLERGLRRPTVATLFQLCRILSVRPSVFVRAIEAKTREKFI